MTCGVYAANRLTGLSKLSIIYYHKPYTTCYMLYAILWVGGYLTTKAQSIHKDTKKALVWNGPGTKVTQDTNHRVET